MSKTKNFKTEVVLETRKITKRLVKDDDQLQLLEERYEDGLDIARRLKVAIERELVSSSTPTKVAILWNQGKNNDVGSIFIRFTASQFDGVNIPYIVTKYGLFSFAFKSSVDESKIISGFLIFYDKFPEVNDHLERRYDLSSEIYS